MTGGQRGMPWEERKARMGPRPWTLDPLAEVIGARLHAYDSAGSELHGLALVAETLGISYRQAKRLVQFGLSDAQADRFSVLIGLHPSLVFGPTWWTGPEPDAPPVPDWLVAA